MARRIRRSFNCFHSMNGSRTRRLRPFAVSLLILGCSVFLGNPALGGIRSADDPPPPRTPLDDWNDMISTFIFLGFLTIAVCAITWLIFWAYRKMRFARLHKHL